MNPSSTSPRPLTDGPLYLGVAFLVSAAVVLMFALTGALRLGWREPSVIALVRALPVPVARVIGGTVTYRQWDDLASAQVAYQSKLASLQGASAQSKVAVRQQALDSVVRLAATRALAKQYHITVSQSEVQQELQRAVDQASDSVTFTRILATYYGWTPAIFSKVVTEPYLLQRKVDAAIATDSTRGEDPKTKADRVLAAVQAPGADFSAIASKESEDVATRSSGGGTLITKQTFSDADVSTAVFALKEGEISRVLTTPAGHFVVKVEKILKDDTTGATVLQAREIFVRLRNVDTVIADRLRTNPPRILLDPFTWDQLRGCVVSPGRTCDGSAR